MSVINELHRLSPGALVELFVLDFSAMAGGTIYRFHAGTNDLLQDITWQAQVFTAWPVQATGFAKVGGGSFPRPTLSFSNVTGIVGALARDFDDLIGAKVLRKRTFVKYLDAANFPGGNPSANSAEAFPDDEFYIDQKLVENRERIDFALAAKCDLEGVKLPLRVVTATCGWKYKGEGCGYVPGNMFDKQDVATVVSANDQCSKRVSGCLRRFGVYSATLDSYLVSGSLPFGGFPGSGLIK